MDCTMLLSLTKSMNLTYNHVISHIANPINFDTKRFHFRIQM